VPDTTSFLIENLDQGNLVEVLDELNGTELVDATTNAQLYNKINEAYEKADQSMDKWRKKYAKALSLAKLIPRDSDGNEMAQKDFPFKGASTAMLPYVMEAMLDFHGRAVPVP
jgi:hypothetical protein